MAKKKPSFKAKRKQPAKPVVSLSLSEQATTIFQQEIRQGPLWAKMVAEFGEAEAERLLRECRVDID